MVEVPKVVEESDEAIEKQKKLAKDGRTRAREDDDEWKGDDDDDDD